MDKHDIPFIGDFYTKAEVDAMVAAAVEEARAIDEASMAEHNFKATIISMILGFICLALFLDGTLRLLGIIPPFLDIDISINSFRFRIIISGEQKRSIYHRKVSGSYLFLRT